MLEKTNSTTPEYDRFHSGIILIINACAWLCEGTDPLSLSNSLINICTNDSNVFIKPTEWYYIHVTDRHTYKHTTNAYTYTIIIYIFKGYWLVGFYQAKTRQQGIKSVLLRFPRFLPLGGTNINFRFERSVFCPRKYCVWLYIIIVYWIIYIIN